MPEIKEKHEKILEKVGNMIRLHFRETNKQGNVIWCFVLFCFFLARIDRWFGVRLVRILLKAGGKGK